MTSSNIKCQHCALSTVCLPLGLNQSDMKALENSISKQHSCSKGEFLVRINDPLTQLFAVRSGAFKSVMIDSDGNQRILDFYLPGEIIGLDGIANNQFHYDIIALENSLVCEISRDKLFSIAANSSDLQTHMFNLMSHRLAESQKINPNLSAQERLAVFLIALSHRHKIRGFSEFQFTLPMSRNDIGAFLGLATETISRTLKKFQAAKLIEVQRRKLTLHGMSQLRALANCQKVDAL